MRIREKKLIHAVVVSNLIQTNSFEFQIKFQRFKLFTKSLRNKVQSEKKRQREIVITIA